MTGTSYTRAHLRQALLDLRLERGDVVFSHSNIGFFGRPADVNDADDLCRMFSEEIMNCIGPDGALVVPTFTYSFPKKEVFDVEGSPSNMGMFAEWVRKQPNALRSADPCYSVAALGGRAAMLTDNAPVNSFGQESFFDRFYSCGGKILNLNFDAGSTFVHYVERCIGVPYRFEKTFLGRVRQNGQEREAQSTIWVRYLSDDALIAAFEPFDRLAREKGLVRTHPLGRGEIVLMRAEDTYNLIADTLPNRPWLLTRCEELGIGQPRIVPEG
ncbi:MAG: AAC(3) family N-acetyltransferase [Filomicrobium sp.]